MIIQGSPNHLRVTAPEGPIHICEVSVSAGGVLPTLLLSQTREIARKSLMDRVVLSRSGSGLFAFASAFPKSPNVLAAGFFLTTSKVHAQLTLSCTPEDEWDALKLAVGLSAEAPQTEPPCPRMLHPWSQEQRRRQVLCLSPSRQCRKGKFQKFQVPSLGVEP